MEETKNTECNIVGPHSHLVAGKTFPCEKEGKPTYHLEEKNYPDYAGKDNVDLEAHNAHNKINNSHMGNSEKKCSTCGAPTDGYNCFPSSSPSDKTWEKTPLELAVLFHNTYEGLAPHYGYETRPDTKDFDPESKNGKLMTAVCQDIINTYLNPFLTSATIKAKDEVLKEMLLYRKSLPQITTEENILDFIVSFVNEKGINLEEPKS